MCGVCGWMYTVLDMYSMLVVWVDVNVYLGICYVTMYTDVSCMPRYVQKFNFTLTTEMESAI